MKAVSLYLGASGGEESHGSIDFRRFVCARVDGLERSSGTTAAHALAVEMI